MDIKSTILLEESYCLKTGHLPRKEFILGKSNENKLELEEAQKSTDIVDRINEPEFDPTPIKGQTLNQEVETLRALWLRVRLVGPFDFLEGSNSQLPITHY